MEILLALETGENEARIRELVTAAHKKDAAGTDSVEDYNGVALHTFKPAAAPEAGPDADVDAEAAGDDDAAPAKPSEPFVWALHEGRWFISTDRALVTGALDALAADDGREVEVLLALPVELGAELRALRRSGRVRPVGLVGREAPHR